MGLNDDASLFAVAFVSRGLNYRVVIAREQLRKTKEGDELLKKISKSLPRNWGKWFKEAAAATITGMTIGAAINWLINVLG